MAYSIEYQHYNDINCFLLDGDHTLIHVASAGGKLPKLIEKNDRKNRDFQREIRTFQPQYDVEINPSLQQILSSSENSQLNIEMYLRDFKLMARRGFYSFDKTHISNFDDEHYHLVAWPTIEITLSTKLGHVMEKLIRNKLTIPKKEFLSFNIFKFISE